MKEEEQDKKQRKRLVHASLFSGFGAPDPVSYTHLDVYKRQEYEKKTKPLLDSIRNNAPRFIETIPSNSPSATMKNE